LTRHPLIELRLELSEPDVIFRPPIDQNLSGNFYDQVEGYVEDAFKMCSLVPRVATHKIPSFAAGALKKAKPGVGDQAEDEMTEKSFADETPSETFDDKNCSVIALKERAYKKRASELKLSKYNTK